MKKITALLMGAVMSISVLLPVLSACGNDGNGTNGGTNGGPDGGSDNEPHVHTVEVWTEDKAPTCTEAGSESGVCTGCGETVTNELPALGHTIENKNMRELVRLANCTEDGLRIVYCPVCKQEVEDVLPALGHDWENDGVNLTEPTCTETGTVNATCTRCGTSDVRTIPALGHDWQAFYTIETAATFDHDGLKYQSCSRCGERTNETVIPKLNKDEPTQYQLRLVRQNGEAIKIAGVKYEIKDESGARAGEGTFRNGAAAIPLNPATYTVTLSSLPKGYSAQPSYQISWENLVADITLTASLIMEPPAQDAGYAVGSVMNDLTFNTIETKARAAETLKLSQLLTDYKAVVLNFWDTSCSFCAYEFPGLEAAYQQYKDDVAVIAVDDPDGMGGEESVTDVRNYVDQRGLTCYVMMDKTGLAEMFNVSGRTSGYPVTVVIDCEGVVSYFHNGALVDPQNYENLEYSTRQFAALFGKYTSAPYYHG